MNDEQAVYRRVLRRETHSARTAAAVFASSLSILVLAAGATVGAWVLIDPQVRDAVDHRLEQAAAWGGIRPTIIAVGIIALLLAVVLVVLAVTPGRLRRRGRTAERMALVVDDGVLADVAADRVARRVGVDAEQVSIEMARRRVRARITPTSGVAVSTTDARDELQRALGDLGFSAEPAVSVAPTGRVA